MASNAFLCISLNPALDHSLECAQFRVGAVNRVARHWVHAGGKGVNVAAFLSDHVASVTISGFLGASNAAPFETLFRKRRIDDQCLRVPGETRANFKILDPAEREVTDLNLPGFQVRPEAWSELLARVEKLAPLHRFAVLAGSLPLGVADGAYAELVARLRHHGCFVALDASGAAMRLGVAAQPSLIKPNHRELEELVGHPLPTRAALLGTARELVREGISTVVVSRGNEGALLVDSKHAVEAEPLQVVPVSTVGAGDAMLSGVLVGLDRGESLARCAQRGTAFAVGTLTRHGPELPPEEELEALLARVNVEEVAP